MANQLPLNEFKTIALELTNTVQTVYITPANKTSIVLGAQASNITGSPVTVTFTLVKNSVDYVMLKEFSIPPNDAAEVTTGKLVIEEGCFVKAVAGANSSINLVLSVLETSNE